jgi:hypothetical protein
MNNGSTFDNSDKMLKVAVNSLQRTLFVERICIDPYFPKDRIIPYDIDNLYPNKIKSIAQRSGTTMSAIGTLAAFISGDGFAGMDTVVNYEGQTLWDILNHTSFSKSMFGGYALHFNFNALGQICEINPINFEFVRWAKDLDHLVVNPDWFRRNMRKNEVEYHHFDPSEVLKEIQEVGIDNYKGQILYSIPCKSDWYTVCNWDSVLDDAQLEAEAKLYGLSSIQNDYSLSGILSYPKALTDQDEIDKIKKDIAGDKGSANAGGVRVVGSMPSENLNNWRWFTPISRNNIDTLHKNQKEDAKFNIYAAFRQPPILNGVATSGMFNQESFVDAFNYYNAQTETERKEIEKQLTKILSVSIFQIKVVQITPKKYVPGGVATPVQPGDPAQPIAAEVNNTLTNLTGRKLQGVFRITRKYKQSDLTYDQAAQLLADGFGFNEEQIKIWLINDDGNE